MKVIATLNPENASEEEVSKFVVRHAARAVVFDNDGNIGLLNVTKHNYYKIPGGGIEEGESIEDALKRECKEEIGCDVEILGELGEIVEYRKLHNLKQTSSCFWAKVVGEKGEANFMDDEIEDGFKIEWLPAEKAISLLYSEKTDNKEANFYMIPRDKIFLELAKEKYDKRTN